MFQKGVKSNYVCMWVSAQNNDEEPVCKLGTSNYIYFWRDFLEKH